MLFLLCLSQEWQQVSHQSKMGAPCGRIPAFGPCINYPDTVHTKCRPSAGLPVWLHLPFVEGH